MIITDHLGKSHELGPNDEVFWRPSVYGLLQNLQGEYLVVRTEGKEKLEFPGGGVQSTETFEEGLIREFFEETGVHIIEIEDLVYLGANFAYHVEDARFEHRLLFAARVSADPSTNFLKVAEDYHYSEEIDFVGWVHPRDFGKHDWQPPAQLIIKHYTL